jgi:hypothetical protein
LLVTIRGSAMRQRDDAAAVAVRPHRGRRRFAELPPEAPTCRPATPPDLDGHGVPGLDEERELVAIE